MQQEKIICPNCGAENSHYGKCEYCGSDINPTKVYSEKTGETAHGIHQVNIDKRVLKQKYDKFEDETETYFIGADDKGWLKLPSHHIYRGDTMESTENVYMCYCQKGWEDDGYVALSGLKNCIIHADGKNYKIDYVIDKKSLLAICVAQSIEIKYGYVYEDCNLDKESVNLIHLLARVFYFTFFDNTQFVDSPEQLFALHKEFVKKKEAKVAEWEEDRKRIAKEEKRKSCVIGIIIFIILALLIIGGMIRLVYRV